MDRRDTGAKAMPHQLILQNRNQLEMTGVEDVQSFDESLVKAFTTYGELSITGNGLHIRRLDLESSSFSVEGRIDAISYANRPEGGFFSRLFR